MINSTQDVEVNLEKDSFEHPLQIKIALTIITIFIIISTIVIGRQLFIFLRRPNRRCIDRIVDIHNSIGYTVTILCMLFFDIVIWTKTPKNYVSHIGCYIGTYIFYFLAIFGNIHSFFVALFRFICIIYPDKLSRRNISPQVKICSFFKYFLTDFFLEPP